MEKTKSEEAGKKGTKQKSKKEKEAEAREEVPARTAVRSHDVDDRKPVSERVRVRAAGEDVPRMS